MIVDLIRHATTGRAGYLDGRTDPAPLPEAVRAVRRAYGHRDWSRVISSPRRRAMETACVLTPEAPMCDPRWREMDFGDWDGRALASLDAGAVARFHQDPAGHGPPKAEPWAAFVTRVEAALASLLDTGEDGSPVLVVSHAGPMRTLLSLALGWTPAQTWSLRLDYGARLRLRLGRGDDGTPWGEIRELDHP